MARIEILPEQLFGVITIVVDDGLEADEFRLGRSICDLRGVVAKGGRIVPLMRATAPILDLRRREELEDAEA